MLDTLLTSPLLLRVAVLADEVVEGPEPEDVKAGWGALGLFLLLVLAIVVLAFSLVKQLRKAQSAKDAGLYGDEPAVAEELPDDGVEGAAGSHDRGHDRGHGTGHGSTAHDASRDPRTR